jgi:hypothetical protein
MENMNTAIKQKLSNKGVTKDQLAQRNAMEEQANAASEKLSRRKKELQKL